MYCVYEKFLSIILNKNEKLVHVNSTSCQHILTSENSPTSFSWLHNEQESDSLLLNYKIIINITGISTTLEQYTESAFWKITLIINSLDRS